VSKTKGRGTPPCPLLRRGGDKKVPPLTKKGVDIEVPLLRRGDKYRSFPSYEEGIKGCSCPICGKREGNTPRPPLMKRGR